MCDYSPYADLLEGFRAPPSTPAESEAGDGGGRITLSPEKLRELQPLVDMIRPTRLIPRVPIPYHIINEIPLPSRPRSYGNVASRVHDIEWVGATFDRLTANATQHSFQAELTVETGNEDYIDFSATPVEPQCTNGPDNATNCHHVDACDVDVGPEEDCPSDKATTNSSISGDKDEPLIKSERESSPSAQESPLAAQPRPYCPVEMFKARRGIILSTGGPVKFPLPPVQPETDATHEAEVFASIPSTVEPAEAVVEEQVKDNAAEESVFLPAGDISTDIDVDDPYYDLPAPRIAVDLSIKATSRIDTIDTDGSFRAVHPRWVSL